MGIVEIPIDKGWIPDFPNYEIAKIGGLSTAVNVYPVAGGYIKAPGPQIFNNTAVLGTPLNGFTFEDSMGIYRNFLGTSIKLYRFTETQMTDVTRIGGDYNATHWSFENYGDWVLATNGVDDIQVMKSPSNAHFESLAGSPPKAKYMLFTHGHLILANLIDNGIAAPKRIRWSARENIEDWQQSLITGADFQDFPDMEGSITGIGRLGENFIITSKNSITIGYYIGGSYTFGFKINAYSNIGCYFPNSFISIGDAVFFWDRNAIYMLTPNGIKNISANRVQKTIFDWVNIKYNNRVSVAHDKDNNLIIWASPSWGSFDGKSDVIIVYNYVEDKFSALDFTKPSGQRFIQCIFNAGIVREQNLIDNMTTVLIDDTNELIDTNSDAAKIQPVIVDADNKVNCLVDMRDTHGEIQTGEISDMPSALYVKELYIPVNRLITDGIAFVHHRYGYHEAPFINHYPIKRDNSVDTRVTNRLISFRIRFFGEQTRLSSPLLADIIKRGRR